MKVFSQILDVECPEFLTCDESGKNPAFEIVFRTNGDMPFAQVILHGQGMQKLIKDVAIQSRSNRDGGYTHVASIPAGLLRDGDVNVQVEGCRQSDLSRAEGSDWIKEFRNLKLTAKPRPVTRINVATDVKLYFGIHKHMHQPYYQASDLAYWDGEKDQIFGSRAGNYTSFVPHAIRQYHESGLPFAGLSTSWSGSLIEQLDRCSAENLSGGVFRDWNQQLRDSARLTTKLGNPRLSFSAFGFYHPLMALIPDRDIIHQIEWHRDIIKRSFGVEPSRILFPPETALHVRMIPALNKAGIEAVIYDSIHRYRACRDYPYAGIGEGMLPPNQAEQCNTPAKDWLQLHNVWAGSKIAPSLLKPEYIAYEDPDGEVHKIIGVPAERYIGNEDARGGFGALQYPDVLGQVYDQLVRSGGYDPKHPTFFLLHSDGDNHGGGADSYYGHNTSEMLHWLKQDPRFELIGIEDYLQLFPPDPNQAVHIEPGSWSGADNGDPQFMKWFSRYDQPYSPDLNSWAVLTAFQNLVHTLEDNNPIHPALHEVARLMYTAETSCYWYWTGQLEWDWQVTSAANRGWQILNSSKDNLHGDADNTPPTIFAPWVTPENPGGKCWGQGCLNNAPKQATAHSFIYDLSGLKRVELILRSDSGETQIKMTNHGPYPSQTGAQVSANYCTAELPVGAGLVRYFIEAEDCQGNIARSALERIYLG